MTRIAASRNTVSPRALPALSLLLAGAAMLARLPLLWTRRFDPDELEHSHAAWCIQHGLVPFRDFFEMHMPFYHYLLAAFFSLFDVAAGSSEALHALAMARLVMWAVSVGTIACTFVLARQTRDATTAWVALPIAAGSFVLALRGIEIRPDGLSTFFWMASLVLLWGALADKETTRPRFVLAGVTLGLALITTQKLLLAGPPLFVIVVFYVMERGASRGGRVRDIAAMAAAVTAVVAVPVAWFAWQGAFSAFLHGALLQGSGWKTEVSPRNVLALIATYDPWTFPLAAGGLLVLVRQWIGSPEAWRSSAFLVLPASALFLGLFLIPVPYPQYCLTFLPLFAILAATLLVELVRAVAEPGTAVRTGPGALFVAVVTLVVILLGWIDWRIAQPVVLRPFLYPAGVLAGLLALYGLARTRLPEVALCAALMVLTVLPARWTVWMIEMGDQGQFAALRYVMDRTSDRSVVLDGWSGYGVFRPHASYYWMLHPGVRAMLSQETVSRFVGDLVSGRIRPDIVVLDDQLRQLSPALVEFVDRTYFPAGVGDIRLLRHN